MLKKPRQDRKKAETGQKSSQREFWELWEASQSAMGEMGHDGVQTGLPQACPGTKTKVSRKLFTHQKTPELLWLLLKTCWKMIHFTFKNWYKLEEMHQIWRQGRKSIPEKKKRKQEKSQTGQKTVHQKENSTLKRAQLNKANMAAGVINLSFCSLQSGNSRSYLECGCSRWKK